MKFIITSIRFLDECQFFTKSKRVINFSMNLSSLIAGTMLLIAGFTASTFAEDYWVSPNGTSSWNAANSATPLAGTLAASLATANENASAGDTIHLRGGVYTSVGIIPANSGTASQRITWQPYDNETVVIRLETSGSAPYSYGIFLSAVSYHTITGIEIDGADRLVHIYDGASYNEISHSVIHGGAAPGSNGVIIRDTGADDGGSKYNWIHNCIIYDAGYINETSCQDEGRLFDIGSDADDGISDYNTIENNELYWGGHFVFRTHTRYNVIRNNIVHNEAWLEDDSPFCDPSEPPAENGKWGNRCINIFSDQGFDHMYNLVEGNTISNASAPPDGGGADGLTLTSPSNIVRYNQIFNSAQRNIFFKQSNGGDSDNNHVYNNTCYKTTGERQNSYGLFLHSDSDFNVIVNNVFYDSFDGDINPKTDGNTVVQNWLTSDGDPMFTSTNINNPNFTLVSGSPLIDNGTHLTTAVGSGSESTVLSVEDAFFFQDGSWGSPLSDIQGDWIAVGTIDNVVQISSINYSSHTINLSSPISWNNGDKILLFRISTGTRVLHGEAPDQGAVEFLSTDPPQVPADPDNLVVQ